MRSTTFAAFSGFALLAAVPAAAQDVPADENGFNGIYIGAAGGFDVQSNDVGSSVLFDRNLDGRFDNSVLTGTGGNAFAPTAAQPQAGFCNGNARTSGAGGCTNDKDDFGYYGRIGIDQQRGSFVIGAVAEFGKSEISDSVTAFSITPAAYVFTRKLDWEASFRARAGFTPNSTTLFYGTFGPSWAQIDNSYRQTQTTNSFTTRGDKREFGINGGGGVEQKLGRNISVGLEYMYHQYKNDDFRVRLAGAAGTPFTNAANGGTASGTDFRRSDEKFRWHSMRGTVNFRF
jgi:outer membrane immunogenic protein